jgi:O-methyltransferase
MAPSPSFLRQLRKRAYLAAASRVGWYLTKATFAPYKPLDLRPFRGPNAAGNLRDYVQVSTIELLSREIHERGVAGVVAELGVAHGAGAQLLNSYFADRELYLFDTFTGFDERDQEADARAGLPSVPYDLARTSPEHVLQRLPYPERAVIRAGWFPESAEGLEDLRFAFVRIDVGLGNATRAGLEWFYPRLSPSAYLTVADYNTSHTPGVKRAVREFTAASGASYSVLPDVNGTAIFTKPVSSEDMLAVEHETSGQAS